MDGLTDGDMLGLIDGDRLGDREGDSETLGETLGLTDGLTEGEIEGDILGVICSSKMPSAISWRILSAISCNIKLAII